MSDDPADIVVDQIMAEDFVRSLDWPEKEVLASTTAELVADPLRRGGAWYGAMRRRLHRLMIEAEVAA